MQCGERVVRRVPPLLGVVPLEHGKVGDPEKTKILGHVASFLEGLVLRSILLPKTEPKKTPLLAEMLHALVHDCGVFGPARRPRQQPEIISFNFSERNYFF